MDEREVLGLEAIRLLAHPLRQRIEKELRRGPVTATSLAKALGENTGLTSYHLRQLARYGFVEEVPELGRGREKWWRFLPKDRRVPDRAEQSPEMRAVLDEVVHRQLTADLARFAEATTAEAFLPVSVGTIEVTPDELRQFFEEYVALLYRYKRPGDEVPPDARVIHTRFFAYPDPPE